MLERNRGIDYMVRLKASFGLPDPRGNEMTSSGLQKLAFALLVALILYATVTAAGV